MLAMASFEIIKTFQEGLSENIINLNIKENL